MITDSEKWHYLAVKSLPALLKGIKSNHNKDFYCLNSFLFIQAQKIDLKNMKKPVLIKIIVM